MSETHTLSEEELTQQQRAAVAAYLQYDPDFFHHYPELLDSVKVSCEARGTVSLVDIQLRRLRERVVELEEEITGLMGHARNNEKIFRQFAEINVRLYQVDNITQARCVLKTLAEGLDLSVTLRLFDDPCPHHEIDKASLGASRVAQLSQQQVYLGRLQRKDAELLFDVPPELGSFAVMPIGRDAPIGILAFASSDGGHFQPQMDTLFLQQLSALLSALIPIWLVEEGE
ncbi:DUF484 family protein [Thaumasiovibrio sp. DFM-14]|uniref:DUF484 family protein n=1 Tax=Thaumasiovibrio sp. DFM-14 TaxID=3384792 RepID=UPI00399F64F1